MDQKVLCVAVTRSDPVVAKRHADNSHLSHLCFDRVEIIVAFNTTMKSSVQTQRDAFRKQRKGFAEGT